MKILNRARFTAFERVQCLIHGMMMMMKIFYFIIIIIIIIIDFFFFAVYCVSSQKQGVKLSEKLYPNSVNQGCKKYLVSKPLSGGFYIGR